MKISDAELELFRDWQPGDSITMDVKGAIYKGSLRVGTVTSSTLAKHIVRLLNRYPANEKGV